MKLPLSWLKDYMNTDGIEPAEYMHKMTMSGSIVEGIENAASEFKNVVTGKIVKIDKSRFRLLPGRKMFLRGRLSPLQSIKARFPEELKLQRESSAAWKALV